MAAQAEWDLEIRLLGDLEVTRSGSGPGAALTSAVAALSRKTRALFAFLVATRQRQTRRAICELLWEGPDDPLGALRWSLSRLRGALGPDRARIEAVQDRIGFRADRVRVDWHAVRDLVGGEVEKAPTDALCAAAADLRGEFLDGLHLDDCLRFSAWCASERESARTLQLRVLRTLVARLTESPEAALPHARAWTAADPMAEAGHASLIRLLGSLGRNREALEHYGHARRMLELEAGVAHSPEIELARMSLRSGRSAPSNEEQRPLPAEVASRAPAPGHTGPVRWPLVGRVEECAVLEAALDSVATGRQDGLILLSGEPGIGKTRLASWLSERAQSRGGRVLTGRGFEAETGRPFGLWIDLFGALALDQVPAGLRPELVRLMPALAPAAGGEGDRARMFESVTALLRQLPRSGPLLLVFDDLQWADEASLALLHFAVRSLAGTHGLLLAATARAGELADNPAAIRLARELQREGRLRELRLGPLAPEQVQALTAAAYPEIDPAPVLAHAEGNPLFALEAARAIDQGAEIGASLEQLVAGHLGRLGQDARRLLPWAAALGRSFSADLLASVCAMPAAELDRGLAELEQHTVLGVAAGGSCRFAHDTYRQAAYRQLSEPRRRLMHLQIARTLAALDDPDGDWAADLARHAALGGDVVLAARACLAAGQRCLRLFASGEARAMADRGLHHLGEAAPTTHVAVRLQLLRLKVLAGGHKVGGPGTLSPASEAAAALENALVNAVVAARAAGAHQAAAVGHHALSLLYQDRGDLAQAQVQTLEAEGASRAAGAASSAHQQANTACCLILLQRDLSHARQLLAEASATADRFRVDDPDLHWAAGLLHAWDGDHEAAARRLERAVALAVALGDRHREHGCRVSQVLIELERPDREAARASCQELVPIAAAMGAAEQAHAEALAELTVGATSSGLSPTFTDALDRLRMADSKAALAYLLVAAAAVELEHGRVGPAQALATEAADLADRMGLANEAALAAAVLARTAIASGDAAGARSRLAASLSRIADPDALSAGSRQALRDAAHQAGLPLHTAAHTGTDSQ